MKTLNISIPDELVAMIVKAINEVTLNKCIELAEKYHLSDMSMDDISER